MNEIFISDLSPIRFYEVTSTQSASYHTKRFDDFPFSQQLLPWQEPKFYVQKWEKVDVFKLQIETDFEPVQLHIVDSRGISVDIINFVKKLNNKYDTTKWAREAIIDMSALPDGCYGFDIYVAGQSTAYLFSEPFHLKEKWENTLLFEYSSSDMYHQGVLFGTGIAFKFRVEGTLDYPKFGANTTGAIDQQQNPVITNSIPTVKYPCVIGGTFGVPPWVPKLLSNIFSCDNILIDGKPCGKEPDEELSYNEEDNYPMKAVTFELMEGINRPGKIFNPAFDVNKKFMAIFNINSRVFGDANPAGPNDTIAITGLT